MSKLRERFEAKYSWCALGKDADGNYLNREVQIRFEAYQAALEPVRELVKQWQTGDGFNGEDWYGLSKCRDELANLLED